MVKTHTSLFAFSISMVVLWIVFCVVAKRSLRFSCVHNFGLHTLFYFMETKKVSACFEEAKTNLHNKKQIKQEVYYCYEEKNC